MHQTYLFGVHLSGCDQPTIDRISGGLRRMLIAHYQSEAVTQTTISITAQTPPSHMLDFALIHANTTSDLSATMHWQAKLIIVSILEYAMSAFGWKFEIRVPGPIVRPGKRVHAVAYPLFRKIVTPLASGIRLSVIDEMGTVLATGGVGGSIGRPTRTSRSALNATLLELKPTLRGQIGIFLETTGATRKIYVDQEWENAPHLIGKRVHAILRRVRGGRLAWRAITIREIEPLLFDPLPLSAGEPVKTLSSRLHPQVQQ